MIPSQDRLEEAARQVIKEIDDLKDWCIKVNTFNQESVSITIEDASIPTKPYIYFEFLKNDTNQTIQIDFNYGVQMIMPKQSFTLEQALDDSSWYRESEKLRGFRTDDDRGDDISNSMEVRNLEIHLATHTLELLKVNAYEFGRRIIRCLYN